jgi:uncharacterized protein YjbJ (UPF0337 family)
MIAIVGVDLQPCGLPREIKMGSLGDKSKGVANEAMGNIKQGVGKAVGNKKMEAEGVAQEVKGETQQAVGKTKDAIKKGVDQVHRQAHRKL